MEREEVKMRDGKVIEREGKESDKRQRVGEGGRERG